MELVGVKGNKKCNYIYSWKVAISCRDYEMTVPYGVEFSQLRNGTGWKVAISCRDFNMTVQHMV